MKVFQFNVEDGVIAGKENNNDLFIRKVTFSKGYTEEAFHTHPNSFEFYFVLGGKLRFQNDSQSIAAEQGSVVYFEQAEDHKIVEVSEEVTLLVKKIGSLKE